MMGIYLHFLKKNNYIAHQKIRGRDTEMNEIHHLGEVKEKIEKMRNTLNRLIILDVDKEEILQFSRELDKLILEYYNLELYENGKRADK